MRIAILRHGKARSIDHYDGDRERELTHRGNRQMHDVARQLNEIGFSPNLLVTSPATRARQTAESLRDALAAQAAADGERDTLPEPPIEVDNRFYPPDSAGALDRIRSTRNPIADGTVLVGHNPAWEDLVGILTGRRVSMETGACAIIESAGDSRSPGDGWRWKLVELITPG
jgi:phosphohistidine phosphatase